MVRNVRIIETQRVPEGIGTVPPSLSQCPSAILGACSAAVCAADSKPADYKGWTLVNLEEIVPLQRFIQTLPRLRVQLSG